MQKVVSFSSMTDLFTQKNVEIYLTWGLIQLEHPSRMLVYSYRSFENWCVE